DEYKGVGRGELHLGASTTTGLYILPKLLALFHRLYPNIELRTSFANTSQVVSLILNGERAFGFVGSVPSSDQIVSQPWLTDSIVFIVSSHHRLANKRSVDLKELFGETLLQREQGSATRNLVEKTLSASSNRFGRVIELGHPEAIK